nr:uncharacterized protein LOC112491616 [Ziziphus jujuba var. spinosa]
MLFLFSNLYSLLTMLILNISIIFVLHFFSSFFLFFFFFFFCFKKKVYPYITSMDKRKFNLQTFLEQNRNKIPKSVKVDIASSIDQEIEGGIVIHASTFDLGLYLPFHSLIREILSKLGLAPIQLSQNCWRIMFGIIALNQILEINLGWNEFCHCYAVKQNAAGTYYFSHREATTLLVTDLPKAEKGRKDNLISLTGDWERLPGDTVAHWVPRIKAAPTHKSTGLKPRDSDVNHLDLNKALSLPNEERNWKQLRDHLHRESKIADESQTSLLNSHVSTT